MGLKGESFSQSLVQSVIKMGPSRLLFSFFSFLFLPGVVFTAENLREQSTQRYWNYKGEEELTKALNRTRNDKTAKNVILFVGDGMGPNTITASRIYKGGESSQLEFEKFPDVGLLKKLELLTPLDEGIPDALPLTTAKGIADYDCALMTPLTVIKGKKYGVFTSNQTYAVDRTVPDSACTATALFSGIKTNFEVTGLDAGVTLKDCSASLRNERKVSTIIDWAQEAGKDTGFVTTTRVTHATPGALYSHSADRKWECEAAMPQSASHCKDIARQLIEDEPGRNLKVIMGGGRQCLTWNITNKLNDPIDGWACRRNDGRDLIRQWIQDKADQKKSYRVLRTTRDLLGLDYENTDYVLGIFANGHMSYEDLRDKTLEGMPSLKEMTTAAIRVLKKNKNGFVLVVEGGLIDYAHHRGFARRALEETLMFNEAVAEAVRMTGDDTLIIVTSDHSHNLNINGNTLSRNDILGIAMNSKLDGVPYTTLTYSTGGPRNYQYEIISDNRIQRRDPTAYNTTSFDYNQQAGILNDEATHGGVDVAVFATGPLSHLFHGIHEQSYVAHVIAYAAKMGRYSRRAEVPTVCRFSNLKSSGSELSNFFGLSLFCVLYSVLINT